MPIILHTFELLDRVLTRFDTFPDDAESYLNACYYIATKMSELTRATGLDPAILRRASRWSGLSAERIFKLEKQIVQWLHGDLYMQPHGFAVEFAAQCLKPRLDAAYKAFTPDQTVYYFMCFLLYTTSNVVDDHYYSTISRAAAAFETVYKTGSKDHLTEDLNIILTGINGLDEYTVSGFTNLLASPTFDERKKILLFPTARTEGSIDDSTVSMRKSMAPLRAFYTGV